MSIHPATWRLRNEGLVVTANAKIAPIATSASPVAVLMIPLYPPRVIHSTPPANSFPLESQGGAAKARLMGRPTVRVGASAHPRRNRRRTGPARARPPPAARV